MQLSSWLRLSHELSSAGELWVNQCGGWCSAVQARADLHTGTFVQMVANGICQRGLLRQHVKRLRRQGDLCVDAGFRRAVEIVVGLEEETADA